MKKEPKNIAVIGGGISGMASILLLKERYKKSEINLFTDKVGGEYLNGGLKYIHMTDYVLKFLNDFFPNNSFRVSPVSGALFYNGKIYKHPEQIIRDYHDNNYFVI